MGISFIEVLRYVLSIALLAALVAIVVAVVVWLRRGAYGTVSPGYSQALSFVAEKLVLAAENYFSSGEGQAKKKWVLDQIEEWARKRHVPFDADLAEGLIEAAVYTVINGPDGVKAKEARAAVQLQNAGGDPRALPFVKGEAPVSPGPPPVILEH